MANEHNQNQKVGGDEARSAHGSILVVGDPSPDTMRVTQALESLAVTTLVSGAEALQALERARPDLVVADERVGGQSGCKFLERAAAVQPTMVSILLGRQGTIPQAPEGIVATVFPKPIDAEALCALASVALRCASAERTARDLQEENDRLRGIDDEPDSSEAQDQELEEYEGLLTRSAVMRRDLRLLRKVERTDTPVLISGESGTGKQLVARAIHARSRRAGERFIPIHLGSISDLQQERDLFGHVRGAFPGAVDDRGGAFVEASGGTVLLDEISEAGTAVQVALLRVLEEGLIVPVGSDQTRRVDVRIVATTTRNLEELVRNGHFRQDLYYRLNVFPLEMPPLRERAEDILPLAHHFLASAARAAGKNPPAISREARAALESHRWEGNVRELRNVMQRAAILCKGDLLVRANLPLAVQRHTADDRNGSGAATITIPPAGAALQDLEREIFIKTIALANGNQSRAARILGLRESTLRFRLKKLGITPKRQAKSQPAASGEREVSS